MANKACVLVHAHSKSTISAPIPLCCTCLYPRISLSFLLKPDRLRTPTIPPLCPATVDVMDDIVQIVERGEADMARGFFPQPDGDLGNTYQNAQAQTAAEGASETESLNDQVIGQTGITKPNPYEAQTSQPGTEFSATWAQTTISSEQSPSVNACTS